MSNEDADDDNNNNSYNSDDNGDDDYDNLVIVSYGLCKWFSLVIFYRVTSSSDPFFFLFSLSTDQ